MIFFYSDHILLTKLFVIVVLAEAKRILNLPIQNELLGTGLKNITILKVDNSEFVFEKINQVKISVNKYQVKIEDNGSAGNKKNREISIQNSSSFRIFENIRPKSSSFLDLGLDMLEIKNNDFGLALFNDVSSKQPDVIVNYLNLDEAVYILRKLNALR